MVIVKLPFCSLITCRIEQVFRSCLENGNCNLKDDTLISFYIAFGRIIGCVHCFIFNRLRIFGFSEKCVCWWGVKILRRKVGGRVHLSGLLLLLGVLTWIHYRVMVSMNRNHHILLMAMKLMVAMEWYAMIVQS